MKKEPSRIFRALSVGTRIRIIEILKEKGPLGPKSLAEEVGVSPSAISQHLRVLEHAGLVSKERKGYWIPYSIDEQAMEDCCGHLIEVCSCGCNGGMHGFMFPHRHHVGDDPEALLRYRKMLEEELKRVQGRLEELEKKE